MLPVLGVLSLPFVLVIEGIFMGLKRLQPTAVFYALTTAFLLLYSTRIQMNANALPFWVYYHIYNGMFEPVHNGLVQGYFALTPRGIICGDLLRFKHGGTFPPLERLAPNLSRESMENAEAVLRSRLVSNYYWFPDRPSAP